jgi:hypothetical protein
MKLRMIGGTILRTCAVGILLLNLLIQPRTGRADDCVDERLKPLKHFCGIVVDPQGAPIPNVTISATETLSEQESAADRNQIDSTGADCHPD